MLELLLSEEVTLKREGHIADGCASLGGVAATDREDDGPGRHARDHHMRERWDQRIRKNIVVSDSVEVGDPIWHRRRNLGDDHRSVASRSDGDGNVTLPDCVAELAQ